MVSLHLYAQKKTLFPAIQMSPFHLIEHLLSPVFKKEKTGALIPDEFSMYVYVSMQVDTFRRLDKK